MTDLDQDYFRASHAPTRRLSPLAVIQNVPSIRALPLIPNHTATSITEGILQTKGSPLTSKQRKMWQDNRLNMRDKKIS